MLDINLIKENPKLVHKALEKRGITNIPLAVIINLDTCKRDAQTKNEQIRSKRNALTEQIQKTKDKTLIAQVQELKKELAQSDAELVDYETRLFDALANIPNIVADDVIAGGKEANKVIKTWGKKFEDAMGKKGWKFKDHVELCTTLGLIDYERGTKLSGSGHWVYTDMGARLEWALLNYFVDFHIANGYTFIMPPHILNYESGYAAGQFPKYTDEVFLLSLGKDDKKPPSENENLSKNPHGKAKFLLPTAETALINMHRDETIPSDKLPIKYFGYSPCYRGEAGGYGAGERGMIRGHQFNKIEMFMFAKPEDSYTLLTELTQNAEKLVEGLGLHYQTVLLAAGDTGPVMAKTYDIEVYIPSLGYKEVSSCSNALDYQTRRANIRYQVDTPNSRAIFSQNKEEVEGNTGSIVKNSEDLSSTSLMSTKYAVMGKKSREYLHTLNASGLATSRLIPAIVEQFQNPDGSVTIPPALRKYLGNQHTIK